MKGEHHAFDEDLGLADSIGLESRMEDILRRGNITGVRDSVNIG